MTGVARRDNGRMSASRTVIKNATVVNSGGQSVADILIEGERIVAVGAGLETGDAVRIDARGLLAFPGLIDPHTHLREPGGEHKEDFYTATCAALAGGVTTVFGMPNTNPALIDVPSLDHALALANDKAVCDFGLFLGATNNNATLKRDNPGLRECGLKIYMGSSTGDLLVDGFAGQFAHFEHYPHERVIAVHAEHEAAVRFFDARGQRRPPICAELETARAVTLAEHVHRRLHVCHVSTRREVEIIAAAKARGAPVTCEFAPHHLFLATDGGWRPDPAAGVPDAYFEMNPPLRIQADVDYLWANLAAADCIATDHAPHTIAEKAAAKAPMGMPGLETMLPLLLSAVHAGKLTYSDIARLCCEGPARVYQIAHKGKIAPGFDADITLVAPDERWVIGERPVYSKCGWTAFAGYPATGAVKSVYLRGMPAFDGTRVLAPLGAGQRVNQLA
jgi:dihydroorotase (multifunctional complex type)